MVVIIISSKLSILIPSLQATVIGATFSEEVIFVLDLKYILHKFTVPATPKSLGCVVWYGWSGRKMAPYLDSIRVGFLSARRAYSYPKGRVLTWIQREADNIGSCRSTSGPRAEEY